MTDTEPRGRGQPSPYDPAFADQARKLCVLGATDSDLADFFDVSERTINRWKVGHEEFCQALKAGKTECDDRVERSLYNRAVGFEWDEAQAIKVKKVTYGDNGKRLLEEERVEVVMVHKATPPDTASCIFWLKNRKKDEWRDRVDAELTGKDGGPIQMDGPIDRVDIARRILHMVAEAAREAKSAESNGAAEPTQPA
jgi:hypothetical protein